MTNQQQRPITPPPELMHQWIMKATEPFYVLTQAACWGADQELEACLAEVSFFGSRVLADKIRNTRRPKPPSLKEQALASTNAILNDPNRALLTEVRKTLELNRRALEKLPDK